MALFRKTDIRMLAMDVDGVLTDGKITLTSSGEEIKNFNVADGMGFFLARKAGFVLAIITGRSSKALEKRMKELGVIELHQNIRTKGKVLRELKRKYGFETGEVAYIGDDINDLPAFAEAGQKFAVQNADDRLRKVADFVTDRRGGEGAVREVINHLLKKQGLLDTIIDQLYLEDEDGEE